MIDIRDVKGLAKNLEGKIADILKEETEIQRDHIAANITVT